MGPGPEGATISKKSLFIKNDLKHQGITHKKTPLKIKPPYANDQNQEQTALWNFSKTRTNLPMSSPPQAEISLRFFPTKMNKNGVFKNKPPYETFQIKEQHFRIENKPPYESQGGLFLGYHLIGHSGSCGGVPYFCFGQTSGHPDAQNYRAKTLLNK